MGKPEERDHRSFLEFLGLDYVLMLSWDSYVAEAWRQERERPAPRDLFTASNARLDISRPSSEGTPTCGMNDLLKVTELKKESSSVANMKSGVKPGPTLWLCLWGVSEAGNTKAGPPRSRVNHKADPQGQGCLSGRSVLSPTQEGSWVLQLWCVGVTVFSGLRTREARHDLLYHGRKTLFICSPSKLLSE